METLKKVYHPLLYLPEALQKHLNLSVHKSLTLTNRAQFRYTDALGSRNIRLLNIKPGQGEDIIHLSLCSYPLHSAPKYIALSYTWGDPKQVSTILCQGKALSVTRNLEDALWQLRESQESQDIFAGRAFAREGNNKTPYFWIDAVCINQSDHDEKNHQVRLMWEIYSYADVVVAWLGKQDETIKRGLNLIKQITAIVEKRSSGSEVRPGNYRNFRITELNNLDLPAPTSPEWDYLFSVLTLPWFSRAWVIQELVAAKMCYFLCGDDIIDSSMLLWLGEIIEKDKLLSSMRNFKRNQILGVNVTSLATLKREGKQHDLTELLWSTHLFRASDPRDRVFALLNMAHEVTPRTFSNLIDYRLNTYEVLIKTADIILRQGSLNLLSFAQAFGDHYSLPSWVPYWTASDYSYTPLIKSWDVSVPHQHTVPIEPYWEMEENHVSGANPVDK